MSFSASATLKLSGDNAQLRATAADSARAMEEAGGRGENAFGKLAETVGHHMVGMRAVATAVGTALGLHLEKIAEKFADFITGTTEESRKQMEETAKLSDELLAHELAAIEAKRSAAQNEKAFAEERAKLEAQIAKNNEAAAASTKELSNYVMGTLGPGYRLLNDLTGGMLGNWAEQTVAAEKVNETVKKTLELEKAVNKEIEYGDKAWEEDYAAAEKAYGDQLEKEQKKRHELEATRAAQAAADDERIQAQEDYNAAVADQIAEEHMATEEIKAQAKAKEEAARDWSTAAGPLGMQNLGQMSTATLQAKLDQLQAQSFQDKMAYQNGNAGLHALAGSTYENSAGFGILSQISSLQTELDFRRGFSGALASGGQAAALNYYTGRGGDALYFDNALRNSESWGPGLDQTNAHLVQISDAVTRLVKGL